MDGRLDSGAHGHGYRSARSGRPRVLIIDDDARLRDVLGLVLADDCEVSMAGSGAEALELVSDERFDVIFCDLSMPHMSGPEVHAALERDDPDAAQRMVIVTGGAYSANAEEFLRRASCPKVRKPFTPPDLLGAVEEVIGRYGPADLRRAG